ncbi:MAG: hypothetical protein JSR83_23320 [Proteobacteria bacterium]|nr:hypothetical protein [Pseudomonadota bacterium]
MNQATTSLTRAGQEHGFDQARLPGVVSTPDQVLFLVELHSPSSPVASGEHPNTFEEKAFHMILSEGF